MAKWNLINEGKVRRVYENSEKTRVILAAGDDVSAFDEKLGVKISGKGRILTRMSKYWFKKTHDIVPNAYVPAMVGADHAFQAQFDGAAIEMLELDMLPVEAVVRGYITGSAYAAYSGPDKVREICGVKLPDGLQNCEKLPTPIFTPTTKAPKGQHDENITYDEMVQLFKDKGILAAEDRAKRVRDYSLALYDFIAEILLEKGIIFADTKFEFGINPMTGQIMVADELATPDSSRFWDLEEYEVGRDQNSLDKQPIRDWTKANPGQKVPFEILEQTGTRYTQISDVVTKS